VTNQHEVLASMWANGQFEPTIHFVRFPRFKNFVENMRIDFTHPITALVGPNGANKTTILRVLQSAPGGRDLGNYWFGTDVDVILPQDRHRFIYGRHSATTRGDVEIIKTRIGRRQEGSAGQVDPDLFEPSRPLTTAPDGMAKYEYEGGTPPSDGLRTRWRAISKRVVYIDFRTQISAFDWAFHQAEATYSSADAASEIQLLRRRKAKIRGRSKRLNVAINGQLRKDVWHKIDRIISPLRLISDDEKRWVEKILKREYISIQTIRHRYFRRDGGTTVLMDRGDAHYSEAFAGSGEFAAVRLVVSVMRAKEKSLILLDEPEVSLHPAAQRTAMKFLCEMAKTKKHQIVFATHSPDLIADLPPEAVKVLEIRSDNEQVDLPSQRSVPQLAFKAVGAVYDSPTIAVEDELAAAIVERAISQERHAKIIRVRAIPGGAKTLLLHRVPIWAADNVTNLLLFLDGDQRAPEPRNSSNIPQSELDDEAMNSFGGSIPKLSYGAAETGATQAREVELRRALEWRRLYVRFLPFETPEEYLWSYRIDESVNVTEKGDFKVRWASYASGSLGLDRPASAAILTLQRQAVMQIPYEEKALSLIRDAVSAFLE
jgi:hypothetical protein